MKMRMLKGTMKTTKTMKMTKTTKNKENIKNKEDDKDSEDDKNVTQSSLSVYIRSTFFSSSLRPFTYNSNIKNKRDCWSCHQFTVRLHSFSFKSTNKNSNINNNRGHRNCHQITKLVFVFCPNIKSLSSIGSCFLHVSTQVSHSHVRRQKEQ